MRGVVRFSAGFGSGVVVAAGLAAWLMVPPPHEATAAQNEDVYECYIDNLKQVGSDKAALLIIRACQALEGDGN